MLCPHVWNAQSSGPSIFLWDTRSLTCGVRAMSCVRTLLASSSCSSATPSASSCFLLWFWLTSCFTTRLWYADSSCCCSYDDIKTVQHSPSEHHRRCSRDYPQPPTIPWKNGALLTFAESFRPHWRTNMSATAGWRRQISRTILSSQSSTLNLTWQELSFKRRN